MTIAVAAVTQQRRKCSKLPGCMLCGPVKQVCNLFRLAAGLKHLLVMQDSVHNSLCAHQLVRTTACVLVLWATCIAKSCTQLLCCQHDNQTPFVTQKCHCSCRNTHLTEWDLN